MYRSFLDPTKILPVIRLLVEHGMPVDERAMKLAIENGRMDVVD